MEGKWPAAVLLRGASVIQPLSVTQWGFLERWRIGSVAPSSWQALVAALGLYVYSRTVAQIESCNLLQVTDTYGGGLQSIPLGFRTQARSGNVSRTVPTSALTWLTDSSMSDFSSGDANDPQALSGHAGEHGHAKIDPARHPIPLATQFGAQ